MVALFDVNALIALVDGQHVHHERVRDWFDRHCRSGWATCPLTQNAFVRILSQPKYPGDYQPAELIRILREVTSHPAHQFWPDATSLLDPRVVDERAIRGPKQITDVYLLALAVESEGRLLTLDTRLDVDTIPVAESHHLIALGE